MVRAGRLPGERPARAATTAASTLRTIDAQAAEDLAGAYELAHDGTLHLATFGADLTSAAAGDTGTTSGADNVESHDAGDGSSTSSSVVSTASTTTTAGG